MTPTTLARAKMLAKSLRSETVKHGFPCTLTACQAAIAAGSGASDWNSLTSQINGKQTALIWQKDKAAATLAELAKIDIKAAEKCVCDFADRVAGRPGHSKKAKLFDDASCTILGLLKFEAAGKKIRAFEKSDDGDWVEIDPQFVSIFPADESLSPGDYPFYLRFLHRASRVPKDCSDPDLILAGLRSHTDLIKSKNQKIHFMAAISKVALFIFVAVNQLLEATVGTLPGEEDAISGVLLLPPPLTLASANMFIEKFDQIEALPASYRPFIKYLDRVMIDGPSSPVSLEQAIDSGFRENASADELAALKWLRRAKPDVIARVLDRIDFDRYIFMAPDEMLLTDPSEFHPSMIEAGPAFSYRESDADVFGMIMHHVANIEDKDLAYATSGWLARIFTEYDECELLEESPSHLTDWMRVHLYGTGEGVDYGDYGLVKIDPDEPEWASLLDVLFGDLTSIQSPVSGAIDGPCFILDRQGATIADFAVACIAPNGTVRLAAAEGLKVPKHFNQVAKEIAEQAVAERRRFRKR